MARRFIIIGALILFCPWGCGEIEPPEGKMACEGDTDCPPEWHCDLKEELCYSGDDDDDDNDDNDNSTGGDADSDSDTDSAGE